MSLDNILEEWTVCFRDPVKYHWYQKYMKKGFQHCYAFKLSPGGQFYIVVDPARSHTHIDLLPVTDENYQLLTKGYKFVTILREIDLNFDRGGICRFNCVEVVKSLIGLKSFMTFTPYQLYKRLA